jgi:hypothetical protein
VASDRGIKKNLERVKNLIEQAPGNKGGAEEIIRYIHK